MARLFLSIGLPPEIQSGIAQALDPVVSAGFPIRWAPPALFHLTLKFLGEVGDDAIPGILPVMDRIAQANAPFDLDLGGVGAFPTIRRPQILWVGVDPSPPLRCLKQDLEWGFTALRFERETRAFLPHVSVGRAARDLGAGRFRGLDEQAAAIEWRSSIRVPEVQLMRSDLHPGGAVHSLIHTSPLGTSRSLPDEDRA